MQCYFFYHNFNRWHHSSAPYLWVTKFIFRKFCRSHAGVRLTEGLEDETVLEIKVSWNTSKEGVVLSVDFPGPNYKVQVICASLNSCFCVIGCINTHLHIWKHGSINHCKNIIVFKFHQSIGDRFSCSNQWCMNVVQLKNWHLEGTAKLIFKPLTGTIPGFGAVLVSLTEPVSILLHSV